ncbi:MAG: SMC-Scp complex subunit ScpB [Candidatus Omnitrophica bacterium]|nr:SMC-Scp complex subunit ScpB [Candidatus Omnitrophota bacterium]
MERVEVKRIIEAMLIASEEPLSLEQMRLVLETEEPRAIRERIEELKNEYRETGRSFGINEVAGGYQIGTRTEYAKYIRKLYKNKHVERLSKPALETMAIIAYKQPVTRLDIEEIRGVSVDGVMRSLLEKGLVKVKGRKEVVGRPFLYGTSSLFLKYFGLKSLEDLPSIEHFRQTADEVIEENRGAEAPLEQAEDKEIQQVDVKESNDGAQRTARED